ncbi:MAG: hypothetical protein R6X06_03045 [Gammaproteobacteria bacterium]
MIKHTLIEMKPLRIFLNAIAIVLILLRPELGTPMAYEGWGMVSTLLAPVIAPIIFMLLMLDSLMSRVFMAEKPPEVQAHFRRIMRISLLVGIALFVYWLPYFYYLAQ